MVGDENGGGGGGVGVGGAEGEGLVRERLSRGSDFEVGGGGCSFSLRGTRGRR